MHDLVTWGSYSKMTIELSIITTEWTCWQQILAYKECIPWTVPINHMCLCLGFHSPLVWNSTCPLFPISQGLILFSRTNGFITRGLFCNVLNLLQRGLNPETGPPVLVSSPIFCPVPKVRKNCTAHIWHLGTWLCSEWLDCINPGLVNSIRTTKNSWHRGGAGSYQRWREVRKYGNPVSKFLHHAADILERGDCLSHKTQHVKKNPHTTIVIQGGVLWN